MDTPGAGRDNGGTLIDNVEVVKEMVGMFSLYDGSLPDQILQGAKNQKYYAFYLEDLYHAVEYF